MQPQKVSVLLIMEGSAPRKNSRTIVQKERDVDLIVSLYGLPHLTSWPQLLSHYFAVCGKFLRCTEREGEYAVDAEHEVRCCAESQIDGTFIKKSSCDVWASSKTVLGRCSSNASHSFATSACSGIGARLCTVDELNGNCSSGSGCQFDRAIVWTSTVADSQ